METLYGLFYMKIVSLDLQNVCGYRQAFFNFRKSDGSINDIFMLYGVNGCGKSSILDIINILCSANRFVGRDFSLMFRKMIHHQDYNPSYESFQTFDNVMKVEALFEQDQEQYRVVIEVDPVKARLVQEGKLPHTAVGVIVNELPVDRKSYVFYSDADNPNNMAKFQVEKSVKDIFLDIAEAVYGYKCILENEVEEYDSQLKQHVTYFTDLVIEKDDDGDDHKVRVHYRRMSAGERKIATLLRQLCSPQQKDFYDIYMIDNCAMHIYFERHHKLVEKLLEHFPEKQFFMTTHSGTLIDYVRDNCDPSSLKNIVEIRRAMSS